MIKRNLILLFTFLLLILNCKSSYSENNTDNQTIKPILKNDNFQLVNDLQGKLHNIADNETSPVVFISTEKTIKRNSYDMNPFDFFFRTPRNSQPKSREFKQQGLGSGLIYAKKGKIYYVITNDHVVNGVDSINITIGKKEYKAKIVGADPEVDVAVLSINTKDELEIAKIGSSSQLKVGDFVIAIGNPFGLSHSMTFGIISALGRSNIGSGERASLANFIQTDAAINPGNSGGPLIDINGEVIGINTMIFSQSGGNIGIGFAIPIDLAKKVAEQIIKTGKSEHGWLGIYFQELTEDNLKMLDARDIKNGMLVSQVMEMSPAEKAGIQTGDILTELNGKKLIKSSDLTITIGHAAPGTKVKFKIFRDGKFMTKEVVLGNRNAMDKNTEITQEKETELLEKYGIKIGNISDQDRNQNNIENQINGIIITEVLQGSMASQAGLARGDVVYKINNHKIKSVNDFLKITKQLDDTAYFFVYRKGKQFIIMM